MNKKILIISILTVLMLITISFTSTVSSNTETNDDKKESPLYKIRTNRAIGKNLGMIIDYIKTKFFGERIFFLPFQWLRNGEEQPIRATMGCKTFPVSTCANTGSNPKCCQKQRRSFCTAESFYYKRRSPQLPNLHIQCMFLIPLILHLLSISSTF